MKRHALTCSLLAFSLVLLQGCSDLTGPEADRTAPASAAETASAPVETPGEAAGQQSQTIAEIAAGQDQFSILVQALQQTGLDATLNEEGQYTVFAPTNKAFENLIAELDGVDSASDLLGLPNLKSILLYHVAPGRRFARTVTRQKRINTLNGVFLQVDGTTLTDANGRTSSIETTDVPASNGVIHEIDTVVLPPLD
jgi:uncharacterized surface protein with fasciclin (FAS1) repeats